MRHATTAAIALATTLVLPGCSGSADSGSPDPSPSPRTSAPAPTPPASPTPTAPVMPEAAKAHTKAGARAFVEYFWQVVDYAQATGDTASIRRLADGEECAPCQAGVAEIDRIYSNGGEIHGGESTLRGFSVRVFHVHGTDFATVEYDISVAPTRFDYVDDTKDNSDPATHGRRRARLAADGASTWRVLSLEGLT